MFFENIINHSILLFFFCASYAIGRLIFNNFIPALTFGMSVLLFIIYNIFLFLGINLSSVSLIVVLMFVSITTIINRLNIIEFMKSASSISSFNKPPHPEFLISAFLLLIYFAKCSFPLADGDSLNHYSYLPKLYISEGNFSAGNFILHGKMPLMYPALITFLSYFGTLDIAMVLNFYLTLLIILTLHRMCTTVYTQGKATANSFFLIICIFLANPLMSFIISTGRPYILIAYFSTVLLYFLLSNFNKRSSKNLYVLFLGFVGGTLVSLNYLGMAIFSCLLIALLTANYNVLDKFIKPIFISIVLAVACSLPFYIRTYFLTGKLIYLPSFVKLGVNEFSGYFGAVKALFVLSTRNNQGGNSCCIGTLYLSFLPILLYLVVKRRLWNVKPLLFLFVFIVSYYLVWLTKLPQARSLLCIFPPYLLLLYLLVDLRKPFYKYAIYLFSVLMIVYCVFQFGRFSYGNYLLGKESKVDFVYNVLNKWGTDHNAYDEQNKVANYIFSDFRNHDIVFCDGVFPLTLLPNKVFRLGSERQKHNAILLCPNTTPQTFKPLKHFKSYTIYAYQ